MYKVINTINGEIETIETLEEVKEHINSELEHFNYFEKFKPYTEDDFIIEEIVPCSNCVEGVIQSIKSCGKPMSECCGGCYDESDCEDCDGEGVILKDVNQC
jgi:hypothetical protein